MPPAPFRLVLALLALTATACNQAPAGAAPHAELPKFTGLVVDAADIVPDAEEAAITARLDRLQQSTSDQLVVVTLPSLENRSIEQWGLQLGNEWGVGMKDLDNGVLLIVAPNDRKVRIEVGYGLEGLLTDARAQAIIDQKLLPRFREGDLTGGIEGGIDALIGILESSRKRPMPKLEKVAA